MATPRPLAILLVDDEPVVTETMKLFLEEGIANAQVSTAASVEEGFDKLRERSFDLVITDYQLPGRKGTDLLAELARSSPGTLRVLLTGVTDPELATRAAMGVGIHAYIQKPYSRRRVVSMVRELLHAPPGPRPRVQERNILEAMGRSRTSRWRPVPGEAPSGAEAEVEGRNVQGLRP